MPFAKGNPGRLKGSKNDPVLMSVKVLLEDAFLRNRSAALKHIDDMMASKDGFKFLLSLKASVEPKQLQHTGELFKAIIVNYADSVRTRNTDTAPNI